MANRNMHSEIQTFVGRTIDSELSGNMIDLCPVGALTSKPFRYSARSWELSRRKSISPHDSMGTNLTIQVKNNRVMRVLPRENEEVNECWISDKDRFSYEGLNSSERLLKPMVRVDGDLREVEWNVALDYVSHALKDVVKTHGGHALASLASPHSTLEELHLLQKLTRGLGSGNIDFRPRRRDFSSDTKLNGTPWLGLRLSEIKDLGAALVVGSFIRKDHPLFAQRLRQLAKNSGKVSQLSVSSDDSLISLHENLVVSPATLPFAFARIVKAAAELKNCETLPGLETVSSCAQSKSIAESLLSSEKSAIFLGNVAEQSKSFAQLHILAAELSRLTGARFGFIGEAANCVGGYVAKALPTGLNAYQMFEEPRKAYVLLNIEPELDSYNPEQAKSALKQASLVVMLTPFKHDLAMDYADVLLPTAPFAETSGTFINTEGRVQMFSGVVSPQGETRPGWKILRVLGNVLAIPGFEYESSEQVRNEVLPSGPDFADGLDNSISDLSLSLAMQDYGLQRIADVPIYFSDALVRRGSSLQMTRDALPPMARMSASTLAQAGVSDGEQVRLSQGGIGETLLRAKLDESVPVGCVQIAAAHASTARLGDMFGSINVERA